MQNRRLNDAVPADDGVAWPPPAYENNESPLDRQIEETIGGLVSLRDVVGVKRYESDMFRDVVAIKLADTTCLTRRETRERVKQHCRLHGILSLTPGRLWLVPLCIYIIIIGAADVRLNAQQAVAKTPAAAANISQMWGQHAAINGVLVIALAIFLAYWYRRKASITCAIARALNPSIEAENNPHSGQKPTSPPERTPLGRQRRLGALAEQSKGFDSDAFLDTDISECIAEMHKES